MTEIPEHLLKRAQAARARAAKPSGSDDPAFAGTPVPQHLLDRAKAYRSGQPMPPLPGADAADDAPAWGEMGGLNSEELSAQETWDEAMPELEPRASSRLFRGLQEVGDLLLRGPRAVIYWVTDNGALVALAILLVAIIAVGLTLLLSHDPDEGKPSGEGNCTTDVIRQGDQTVTIRTCIS